MLIGIEFRKASNNGKEMIKGSLYLLLKNADKLSEKQSGDLNKLLDNNSNLNLLYLLKEQLQTLWQATSYQEMANAVRELVSTG